MDYRCRFGLLGNSSTSSVSSEPGQCRPKLQLDRRNIYFFIHLCFFQYSLVSPSSSVSLSYLVLVVPMRKNSGKHSCVSFKKRVFFPITCAFEQQE